MTAETVQTQFLTHRVTIKIRELELKTMHLSNLWENNKMDLDCLLFPLLV